LLSQNLKGGMIGNASSPKTSPRMVYRNHQPPELGSPLAITILVLKVSESGALSLAIP
jgi:hypothetical protein